jgi:hypothetical protein
MKPSFHNPPILQEARGQRTEDRKILPSPVRTGEGLGMRVTALPKATVAVRVARD